MDASPPHQVLSLNTRFHRVAGPKALRRDQMARYGSRNTLATKSVASLRRAALPNTGIPTASSFNGITAGPDGALWFTEYGTNKIGRITTAGAITEFALAANSEPYHIVAGPDGALWFTEAGTNKIGRITTTGTITEYPVPTPGSEPFDITLGWTARCGSPRANAKRSGALPQRVSPSAKSLVPTASSGIDGITVDLTDQPGLPNSPQAKIGLRLGANHPGVRRS